MNKQQQELYEKLLKKVNEYCLGQAAEDMIAAIDALVESYETPKVDPVSEPLQALENIRKEAGIPYFSTLYDIDMWREDFKTVEDALKALEIIKNKEVDVGLLLACESEPEYLNRCCNRYWTNDKCGWKRLSQEEYKFLKEVLK